MFSSIMGTGYDEMPQQVLLSAKGITKSYKRKTVLKDAELLLEQGSALCVFGANGSGKSTLLDILALAARPDSGSLLINGQNALSDPRKLRRRIGYAPQDIALFEELTVKENLIVWSSGDKRESEEAAYKIMDELMLAQYARKKIRELSGGQKRRVNLAVALLGDPDMLVLDEPFAGMDIDSVDITMRILMRHKERGAGVVLSDHSAGRPLELLDQVMILREGDTIYNASSNDFVRLGSSADQTLRRILIGAENEA